MASISSVSGVNNQMVTNNNATGLDEPDNEYDYSKDSETWLSLDQQKAIKENGYCSTDIDDIKQKDVQQTIHLISGYIRIIIQNINVTEAITLILCKYYGIKWNKKIFIELVSGGTEPKRFLTFRRNIKLSTLCNIRMDGDQQCREIEIKQVPSDTLQHVLKYLGHHRGIEPEPLPCPVRSIHMSQICSDKWDAVYMDALVKKTIFEIILASNYMGIQCLLHLGCAKIATLIKALDQTEINRIIEEEEKYRRDHAQDNNDADGDNDDADDDNDDTNDNDDDNDNDKDKDKDPDDNNAPPFGKLVRAISQNAVNVTSLSDDDDDDDDNAKIPSIIRQYSKD